MNAQLKPVSIIGTIETRNFEAVRAVHTDWSNAARAPRRSHRDEPNFHPPLPYGSHSLRLDNATAPVPRSERRVAADFGHAGCCSGRRADPSGPSSSK